MTTLLVDARASIAAIYEAGEQVAQAIAHVQQLEDERPLIKARCIEAMLGTPNPIGKPGAVHSASSAEAVVEQHADYWNHRVRQAEAEVAKHRALAAYAGAKMNARLEVALVEARGEA